MNSYKIKVWELVRVWQQTTVVVNADNRDELDKKIKSGNFDVEDWIETDPEWSTESHQEYSLDDYEVVAEYPPNSTHKDWGNP